MAGEISITILPEKNICQHRIFGIEKDIKQYPRIDSDPNLSLEAFYSLKGNYHQLRVRGLAIVQLKYLIYFT